ncbi:MAG: hypothetical protein LBT49_03305 [Prevotellaceae bacterium]|jgi:hypothetical protein|nr:hypothetical protein [Prevotellaceae bacterium]
MLKQLSNIAEGVATKLIAVINGNLSNRDKANILGEIIQHKGFVTKLKDNETKTATKIFGSIKMINMEYNDNMNAARTLNKLGYNVFMLPKLPNSKSPDFILQKDKMLYIYELKTVYGENSLENRLNTGSLQSDRIILNIVGGASSRYVANTVKRFYLRNRHIKEIKVLLSGKPIEVYRNQIERNDFTKNFMDRWAR